MAVIQDDGEVGLSPSKPLKLVHRYRSEVYPPTRNLFEERGSPVSSPPREKSCRAPDDQLLYMRKSTRKVRSINSHARSRSPDMSSSDARWTCCQRDREIITPPGLEARKQSAVYEIQIERPKSALHSGDFHESGRLGEASTFTKSFRQQDAYTPVQMEKDLLSVQPKHTSSIGEDSHSQANSYVAHSPSFVYKFPTSPLVQSSRPDTPDASSKTQSHSPDRSRRHTFSPPTLPHFHTTLGIPKSDTRNTFPPMHLHRVSPYQAHQPRRSLQFPENTSRTASSARRISLSESPLHHAPMVGSYEESILRGRMSTTPSRPLDFVAQIGVLGKGRCKPSLRCPPHTIIPFPAVFYSYDSGNMNALINNQPSPYVGLIDIENGILSRSSRALRGSLKQNLLPDENPGLLDLGRQGIPDLELQEEEHAHHKSSTGALCHRTPTGGCYRIPEKGQLQIIIKNPNKTAVKLFLIPYDLADMEPGQKTFIRQRSYSAGPLIDMPLSARRNFGTDRPEASLNAGDDPQDRPVLRYLIHLHICCPSRGRFYLYKSIRVVFANRVPDGKEKLRNEIQFPEPRYSDYKPGRNDLAIERSVSEKDAMKSYTVGEWPKMLAIQAQSANLARSLPFVSNNLYNSSFMRVRTSATSRNHSRSGIFNDDHNVALQAVNADEETMTCPSSTEESNDKLVFPKGCQNLHKEGRYESLLTRRFQVLTANPVDG